MKNRVLAWCGLLLFWSGGILAGDLSVDRLKIDLGAYFITNTTTTLSYVSPSSVGVTVDSEHDLDWETSLRVFRLNGLYRFDDSSSLDFSYYSFKRDGNTILDEQLTWGDDVYPINTNLLSEMNQDIYKFSYLWSFHHDEKVELGGSIGMHITRFEVNLEGSLNGNPVDSESTNVTAPLPVVGFKLNYRISPALTWSNKIELFHLNFGDTTGSFSDIKVALEYRFSDTFGCGLAATASRFKVEHEDNRKMLFLDDHLLGLNAYLTLYF